MRTHIVLILVAACAGLVQPARAQWQYDKKQMPLLPPYCKYTQLYRDFMPGENRQAKVEYWEEILGRQNFMHLHHYCWALENTNRALYSARDKVERDQKLRLSLGDFDYVIRSVTPDFVLLPEILTKKGENLARLRTPQAVTELGRAIDIKPDYWPPYAALSDYFRDLDDVESARMWLQRGLKAVKDGKPLQRRLHELARINTRPRAVSKD